MKTFTKFSCGLLALTFLALEVYGNQSLEERLDEAHQLLTSNPKSSAEFLDKLERDQNKFTEPQKSRFLLYKSHNLLMLGDYEKATLYLNKLLESSKNINAKAQAYSMLAVIYASNSEYMNAFVNIEKARLLLNDLTDDKAIKTVLANATTIYTEVGFIDKAYEFSNSYLKEVNKQGLEKELCYAYYNSGSIELQLQSDDKAKDYFTLARENCKKADQEIFYILASQELASISVEEQKEATYLNELKELQKKVQAIDWDIGETSGLIKIADVYLKMNENEHAIEYARQSLDAKSTNQYLPHKKESTRILASAYSNLGNNKKAIEYYQLYIDTERQIQLQLKQRKMAYYIAMQSME